ncbi:MAG: hypothetical protein IKU87_00905 [Clostridia bacterium]|nr:hypothetical protein [Clostridia bacterium]
MGKVTTTLENYKNYGKCLKISNGLVKILITVDVGPRIINYSFEDGENMMFEDLNRAFFANGPEFEKFGGGTWYIYGGHRLWTSPEAMPKSYYPDNDPVPYEIIENGAIFTCETQKWNQYQFEIEVTLAPDSSRVKLVHKITNRAAWDVTLAPWTLTVLSPGGYEVIAQPTKDTGLLGNRLLGLWPYTKMTDDRVSWGDRYIGLEQKEGHPDKFKLGLNSEHGFAMYFNHGDLFIKKYDPIENGVYPDGGMSFETFTNGLFLEMETLGEITAIAPEETVSHTEYWSLFKEARPENFDEEKIDELVKKYVR